ncbi:hypothetical protein [Tissierella sp. Yu-01]|uniref:hypothetical protein n=1 Tax=Tissierella sp. Yu-01 TaxID=3035694 RepID=UPI00240E347B|nr:hypothetical protein [Tissierella sp. Yu-01]WFA09583.1 hypothetical protein P3962_03245 [Tissierella sp. Yu-01]
MLYNMMQFLLNNLSLMQFIIMFSFFVIATSKSIRFKQIALGVISVNCVWMFLTSAFSLYFFDPNSFHVQANLLDGFLSTISIILFFIGFKVVWAKGKRGEELF